MLKKCSHELMILVSTRCPGPSSQSYFHNLKQRRSASSMEVAENFRKMPFSSLSQKTHQISSGPILSASDVEKSTHEYSDVFKILEENDYWRKI